MRKRVTQAAHALLSKLAGFAQSKPPTLPRADSTSEGRLVAHGDHPTGSDLDQALVEAHSCTSSG